MVVAMLQDAATFSRAQTYTNQALDEPWNLNVEYLAARGWTAILLPGSVSNQDGDRANPSLLSAMAAWEADGYLGFHTEGLMLTEDLSGKSSVFASHSVSANQSEAFIEAVGAESLDEIDWYAFDWGRREEFGILEWCFSVGPTSDDLDQFWREHISLYNMVAPKSESFLIVNVGYDFHVIAGPKEFVESALGGPIEVARTNVKAGDYWHQGDRNCFLGYAARYEGLNS